MVLARMLQPEQTCDTKVAIFFLMLASEIIITVFGSERKFLKILSWLHMWASLISFLCSLLCEMRNNHDSCLLNES